MEIERDQLIKRLIEIRYERNDIAFERNMIRVRGDTVEVWPAYYKDSAIRIEFFGDEIDRVSEFNPVTGEVLRRLTNIPIFPGQPLHHAKGEAPARRQGDTPRVRRAGGLFQERGQAA